MSAAARGRPGRMFFSRVLEGEDLVEAIRSRAEEVGIRAGILLLIGSLKVAMLGYYKEGEYQTEPLNGPLEVASCIGNVGVDEKGEVIIHAHIVVSDEKGKAFGGHLMKGSIVGATAELMMMEAIGVNLLKVLDSKTNLRLWRLG